MSRRSYPTCRIRNGSFSSHTCHQPNPVAVRPPTRHRNWSMRGATCCAAAVPGAWCRTTSHPGKRSITPSGCGVTRDL